MDEPFQERRFADSAGPGNQAQGGLIRQVPQARQSLLHAVILPQGFRRDPLGEGLAAEFEMREKH
jgi:hypothetical protein